MNNIIFSKNIFKQDFFQTFFGIPVRLIKVMITSREKRELNHFERAVLSLLFHNYYTILELAEILVLKPDLIEFIIYNLKLKQYLAENNKPTTKAETALKNEELVLTEEVKYVFFDLNRNTVFLEFVNQDDIELSFNRHKVIELETDAFTTRENYKVVSTNKNNKRLNYKEIEKITKSQIFKKHGREIVEVEVLEIESKQYHLISCLETNEDLKGYNFKVLNPLTLENDDDLVDFINFNNDDNVIKSLVEEVMKYRKSQFLTTKEKKIHYDTIKNKLFNKQIKLDHEMFIYPLMKVIETFETIKEGSYQEKLKNISKIKVAMIQLGDLFENVLYQIALEKKPEDKAYYKEVLTRSNNDNAEILAEIAGLIGFSIGSESTKVFKVNLKSVERVINNLKNSRLFENISWNLTIAKNDVTHPFYQMAKKYPNFINLMYRFKRDYRDINKHTLEIDVLSPKLYLDILWDLLNYSFGYKINEKMTKDILNIISKNYDYAHSEEYLKLYLGNKLFLSNDYLLTSLRMSLITMYDSYATENSNYLQMAYTIVDETVKTIANSLKEKYKFDEVHLKNLFKNSEDVIEFLNELGFNLKTYEIIGNKVADSLETRFQNNLVFKGFKDDFKNSVLRVKLLAIISMMKLNDDVVKEFKQYKDLFILTSTISYIQRHQQSNKYKNKEARIIIDEVLKFIDFLINHSDLI